MMDHAGQHVVRASSLLLENGKAMTLLHFSHFPTFKVLLLGINLPAFLGCTHEMSCSVLLSGKLLALPRLSRTEEHGPDHQQCAHIKIDELV